LSTTSTKSFQKVERTKDIIGTETDQDSKKRYLFRI